MTGSTPSAPLPFPLRCLSLGLWVAGILLLVMVLITVVAGHFNPQGWEFKFAGSWSDSSSSTSLSYRGGGLGRHQQPVFSALLILGVFLIAGSLALKARRFSLRTLLVAVLLAGVAGSVPQWMKWKKPTAYLSYSYSPPMTPEQRAEVEALLKREVLLREIPDELRAPFERIPFTAETEPFRNGLQLRLGFPDDVAEHTRDSIVAFSAQYMQLLMLERTPSLNARHSVESPLRSEWSNVHAADWEKAYRARRALKSGTE